MTCKTRAKHLIKFVVFLFMVVSSSYFFIGNSQASEDNHQKTEKMDDHAELTLSAGVTELLNEEMRGIESGMQNILPAIAAGDFKEIAHISQNIKDSFILKQKLTQEQMEELHQVLPADFVAMDQNFHVTSGKLASAAHQQDAELVNFYYYKLYSQCTTCHSKYATKRFPNLKSSHQAEDDHHSK